MKRARPFAAALAAVLLNACSSMSGDVVAAPELAELRAQGYRIAVMPFSVSAPEEGFLQAALAPVGAVLSLDAGAPAVPARARLGDAMRADLMAWLVRGDFEVAEPWATDTALAHAGWSPAQMRDPARAVLAARTLGVDGVLYGDVVRFNRSYYVLQATAEVGLRLQLVHGGDGRRLFGGEHDARLGAGLSGGPTGLVSAATEPIAGLRDSTLGELTRATARALAAALNGDGDHTPAAPAPRLSVVGLAAPHPGPFAAGERVEVVAIGTPDCDVRFDLGPLRRGVPMTQRERHPDPRGERATYVGHYVVQPTDRAEGLPLRCTIRAGTTPRPDAAPAASRVAWLGTVTLGTRSP